MIMKEELETMMRECNRIVLTACLHKEEEKMIRRDVPAMDQRFARLSQKVSKDIRDQWLQTVQTSKQQCAQLVANCVNHARIQGEELIKTQEKTLRRQQLQHPLSYLFELNQKLKEDLDSLKYSFAVDLEQFEKELLNLSRATNKGQRRENTNLVKQRYIVDKLDQYRQQLNGTCYQAGLYSGLNHKYKEKVSDLAYQNTVLLLQLEQIKEKLQQGHDAKNTVTQTQLASLEQIAGTDLGKLRRIFQSLEGIVRRVNAIVALQERVEACSDQNVELAKLYSTQDQKIHDLHNWDFQEYWAYIQSQFSLQHDQLLIKKQRIKELDGELLGNPGVIDKISQFMDSVHKQIKQAKPNNRHLEQMDEQNTKMQLLIGDKAGKIASVQAEIASHQTQSQYQLSSASKELKELEKQIQIDSARLLQMQKEITTLSDQLLSVQKQSRQRQPRLVFNSKPQLRPSGPISCKHCKTPIVVFAHQCDNCHSPIHLSCSQNCKKNKRSV